ncbi:hypothetical protein NLG97_g4029 [Lecanicillium saksenae]|uniref:Uncharacterized protein n=1 Tax=Lecanicillium saksenae TaxID=468837 RepID=A0ACC1QZQ7_9HYPO|nr:hypothetical protein NLG97_g4029 [Lecanicillium saksenae]
MSLSAEPEPQVGDVDWGDLTLSHGVAGAAAEETPACQLCRKKKAKCSREQPCSQCIKSGVDCVYEDKRSKGGVKIGVIERLNQRIDAVENMFLGQSILMQRFMVAQDFSRPSSSLQQFMSTDFACSTDRVRQALSDIVCSVKEAESGDTSHRQSSEKRQRVSQPPVNALEQPAPVETILEVYFKLIHPWIPVLHPSTFLKRARETNRQEGIRLIMQAITSMAMPYVNTSAESQEMREHLSQLRRDIIVAGIESSSKEAIQALILVTFDTIKRGLSRSPWSLVAVICRKIEALQLNSEENRENQSLATFFTRPMEQLEPPTAWVEVEERRRVFWGAFLLDRFCSITTSSIPNISSKSIQRRLPCDGCMWELDQCVETSFFKIHDQTQDDVAAGADNDDAPFPPVYNDAEGPTGIGGLAYTIEATESLYLVTKFHERHSLEPDSSGQLSSWLHKFRQLDSRLLQWELCLTHRWREVRVVDGYIDPNLTIAHMTHNAAIITLHGRLAQPPKQAREWLSSLVSGASKEACVMAAIKIDRIARRFLDASTEWNATRLSDTVSSLMTVLSEVSTRTRNGMSNSEDSEDPASKLRKELVFRKEAAQNSGNKAAATTSALGAEATTSNEHPMMNMMDFSAMLQQFSTSPSSGGSVFGMNFLDQESPVELNRSLATTNHALSQGASTEALASNNNETDAVIEADTEFDFMAELRKLESKAREHGRRLRGHQVQAQLN